MRNLLGFIRKHSVLIIVALLMLFIGSLFGPSQAQVEEQDAKLAQLQDERDHYKKQTDGLLTDITKLEKENKTYKDKELAVKKKEDELKLKEEEAKQKAEAERVAAVKKKEEEQEAAKQKAEAEKVAAAKKNEEEAAQIKAEEEAMAIGQEEENKVTAQIEAEQEAAAAAEVTEVTEVTEATQTSFANCDELRTVHPDGVPQGHPAYEAKMDRDKDAFACEK